MFEPIGTPVGFFMVRRPCFGDSLVSFRPSRCLQSTDIESLHNSGSLLELFCILVLQNTGELVAKNMKVYLFGFKFEESSWRHGEHLCQFDDDVQSWPFLASLKFTEVPR